MKIFFIPHKSGVQSRGEQAFTLTEMWIAMGIFSFVILALVYVNMFGMRMDQLVESKLGASQSSRQGFDLLMRDIRSAKIWRLGNGSLSSFTQITNDAVQRANALQVSLTDDTNSFIRYYFDTNNFLLCRTTNGASSFTTIAKNLTNSFNLYGEDYQGNLETNLTFKYVIHVILQFTEYQYPLTKVGSNYLYDYYKMEFRVASHNPH